MNHEPFEFDDVHDLLVDGDDDPSLTSAAEWAFHLGDIIGTEVVHDEPACTVFLDQEQVFIRAGATRSSGCTGSCAMR